MNKNTLQEESRTANNEMEAFLKDYFENFHAAIMQFLSEPKNREDLHAVVNMLKETKNTKTTIYLVGNGGSSAIAEHMAVDLT
ncbi:MAG: hypothetical protein GF384_06260, partial [Elusimicrobia bacterium]|nr:hypothetical protein [Elusimicrobiota bacterium]